jgi:hypothetical protein
MEQWSIPWIGFLQSAVRRVSGPGFDPLFVLTDRGLRRGVFTSVPDLTQAITAWAEHWNNNPTPFGKATAEGIITR